MTTTAKLPYISTSQQYKTCPQRLNSQRIQDVPQLINKKPTRNTKQNHMPIKKKVAEGHLPKYNACPPTTKLSHNTRHAPIDRPEASTEHSANHMPVQKKRWPKATLQSTRHAPND